jgi:hypothetical protein
MEIASERLRRRVERDFPEPGSANGVMVMVSAVGESARIQAAMVIWANGDLARVREIRELALLDWRDALVTAELANEDWPERLDAELGPV